MAKPLSELEALKLELAATKAKLAEAKQVTVKVSAKGGVSVYGLGRWPITLYGGAVDPAAGEE